MSYPEYEMKVDAKELSSGFITADEALDVTSPEAAQGVKPLDFIGSVGPTLLGLNNPFVIEKVKSIWIFI